LPLRVVLADDHLVVRQGLRALLEPEGIQIVGEAADGWEAIGLAESQRPDVTILDFSMPGCNGLSAAQAIRQKCPGAATIILTMHMEEHRVLSALRVGTRGYVLKTQVAEELVRAIRQVAAGGLYLSPGISPVVVNAFLSGHDPSTTALTSRERQLLQLIAEGKTTKESASLLNVSVKTAESYRTKLMEKLDIHNTAGLVRYAIRQGVIDA